MSGAISSFTRSSTAPGSRSRCAEARRRLRVAAMTIAAGTPVAVTSPMTIPPPPRGGRGRAEVQEADQLTLGDERDAELDARLFERRERRRVELEALDVD